MHTIPLVKILCKVLAIASISLVLVHLALR